jgi:hypothetical protein
MKNRLTLLLLLLSFVFVMNAQQTAQEYFNSSAKEYVSGDKKLAKELTIAGLNKYPDDPKLSNLMTKIENKEQQQQKKKSKDDQQKEEGKQEGENSTSGDQDKQEEKNQDEQKDGQDDQEQESKDAEKKEGENKDGKQQEQQDQQNKEGQQGNEQNQGSQQAGQAIDINKMSKQDAERLLEAIQREEAKTQKTLIKKETKKPKSKKEKDW